MTHKEQEAIAELRQDIAVMNEKIDNITKYFENPQHCFQNTRIEKMKTWLVIMGIGFSIICTGIISMNMTLFVWVVKKIAEGGGV